MRSSPKKFGQLYQFNPHKIKAHGKSRDVLFRDLHHFSKNNQSKSWGHTRSFQSFAETGPYWHSGKTCLKLTGWASVQNQNTEQTRQTDYSRCNILTRLLDDAHKQTRFIHYSYVIITIYLEMPHDLKLFHLPSKDTVSYHIYLNNIALYFALLSCCFNIWTIMKQTTLKTDVAESNGGLWHPGLLIFSHESHHGTK